MVTVIATVSVFTVLSFATRIYQLHLPASVCWDETHFGKMAGWYINGSFFFDVHPPSGKLMFAMVSYLSGYNGSEMYVSPGDAFNTSHYIAMRAVSATCGSLVVPMIGCTLFLTTGSTRASVIGMLLLVFDHGCLTISRYIILDPVLLFAVSLVLLLWTKSQIADHRYRQFSGRWWSSYMQLGASLALAISVKFVGAFTVLFIGLMTSIDLWKILNDPNYSLIKFGKHFGARIVTLIILPLLLYSGIFVIHLLILKKSGSGDGFFSPAFQSSLQGNHLYNTTMPKNVFFGSIVTVKNSEPGGSYLHSHREYYPAEIVDGQLQQVTGYSHKDTNNNWMVLSPSASQEENEGMNMPEAVIDGDNVKLKHMTSGNLMCVLGGRSAMNKRHFLVYASRSCKDTRGSDSSKWRIELLSSLLHGNESFIDTILSEFMLINVRYNCALHQGYRVLPKWGRNQAEVSCNPRLMFPGNSWVIETNIKNNTKQHPVMTLAPSIVAKLLESHKVMLAINSRLKSNEEESISQPWEWPLNYKGQPFCGPDHRVYLLGNPLIWWFCATVMLIFPVVYAIVCAWRIRVMALGTSVKSKWDIHLLDKAWWFYIAWLMHYLPFYLMSRVLYYHHYYPAFIISVVVTAMFSHWILSHVPTYLSHVLTGSAVAILCHSFVRFMPLSYGMSGPMAGYPDSSYTSLKWLSSWEI